MTFGLSAAAIGLIGAGATVAGGLISANAASNAAETQAGAARDASKVQKDIADQQIALQRDQFDRINAQQEPFRQAGLTGQNRLMQLLGLTEGGNGNGSLMRDFGTADFEQDPGYGFRQSEGLKAIDRASAAGGRFNSGRSMKDILRFSQGLASQEYGDAFNRFQVNRANKLQPLQSLSGLAQSSTNAMGAAGQNFASGAGGALGAYGAAAGQNITGAGNAIAAGQIGGANAFNNTIGQGYSMYQGNRMMDLMQNRYTGGGGSSGYAPDESWRTTGNGMPY